VGGENAPSFPAARERMETTSASYRYIVRSPDVRGGHARLEATRIGVHDVMGLIVNGATVDDVCRSFPDLKRLHVYECLAYYEDHRAEIDDLVADQMRDPSARRSSNDLLALRPEASIPALSSLSADGLGRRRSPPCRSC
jgi:uncharacterized protein (DUF433 family)